MDALLKLIKSYIGYAFCCSRFKYGRKIMWMFGVSEEGENVVVVYVGGIESSDFAESLEMLDPLYQYLRKEIINAPTIGFYEEGSVTLYVELNPVHDLMAVGFYEFIQSEEKERVLRERAEKVREEIRDATLVAYTEPGEEGGFPKFHVRVVKKVESLQGISYWLVDVFRKLNEIIYGRA